MNATEISYNRQSKTPIDPKLRLCIKSQDGNKVYYQVRSNKKIQKVLSTYCMEKNLDYGAVAFLFDGRRIKATKTPNELGLENDDEIDAMFHQTGGGYF